MNKDHKHIVKKFLDGQRFQKSLDILGLCDTLQIEPSQLPDQILAWMEDAFDTKDPDEIDGLMILVGTAGLSSIEFVKVLNRLILEDWHHSHEDIAFTLEKIKSPTSIEPLFRTALTKFPYLEYDDSTALARKCIWGLGEIDTIESRQKLRVLAESASPQISGFATSQLLRIRNPKSERIIRAHYDDKTIRVYQAYGDSIASEINSTGRFGPAFSLHRMTWVKPSFLWMMHRSDWGRKPGQEHLYAIDLTRSGFEEILRQAVFSSYQPDLYDTIELWQRALDESDVLCQFDPEWDIHGQPEEARTIQLGLRGRAIRQYAEEWICGIKDITEQVHTMKDAIERGDSIDGLLPREEDYPTQPWERLRRIVSEEWM